MGKNLMTSIFAGLLIISLLSCTSKPLPDQGVTILSPKTNDVLEVGRSFEIQWKSELAKSEFGTIVTVEFSKDGGKSWEMVQENVPNSGKYAWQIPKFDSALNEAPRFDSNLPLQIMKYSTVNKLDLSLLSYP